MLSDVPTTPSEDTLARLRTEFFTSTSFKQHTFVKSVVIRDFYSDRPPPYLELALACRLHGFNRRRDYD
jgi:hypothetical protein